MGKHSNPFVELSSDTTVENFKPLNGYILIQREEQSTSVGLIKVIPKTDEKVRYEPTFGRVIKLGDIGKTDKKCFPIPFEVEPGDRVLIAKFSGHDIVIQGVKYVLANQDDVLGVLEEIAA